ncbi:MAG: electron transfer flavoprotein subunit alpha/FixB family protein [Dehalococcoidia bacterium]|nr:electron transfer flavoprotein subunit alpha/FixB family protein [Dehalococcoidia bacterium]
MSCNEYHGVWVFAEQIDGWLSAVSLELLGKGRDLASILNTQLSAVLLGSQIENLAQELIYCGADKVYLADDPQLGNYRTDACTAVIVKQVLESKPEILLLGATEIGRDLAPRVAKRLGTGLTADCTELAIEKESGLLLSTKPGYGASMMYTFVCAQARPQMATVRPGVMRALEKDTKRKGQIIRVPVRLEASDMPVKTVKRVKESKKGAKLEEARIIVGAGMGVGSAEKFAVIHQLAEALGAEIGTTKDPIDEGWITGDRMIGQTGKTVKPELYIACGISGAIQHVSGIWDSNTIVAINTDPRADIFGIADYGIVGDLHEVIPALIEELSKRRHP